jgi:hypothetical protein
VKRASLSFVLLVAACSGNEPAYVGPLGDLGTSDTVDDSSADAPGVTDADEVDAEPDVPPRPRRIIAIGDVHGDLNAARGALRLAGAIDADDQWVAGDLIVVQVGDQLDRGDDEREILDLFEVLREQATAAGGEFHPLLGNHEVMNVQLDLRYVFDGGWADFSDIPYDEDDPELAPYEAEQRGRVAAFRPGGPYAMLLSDHLVIHQIEGNVFVHGGVLPSLANYGVDRVNAETSAWMRGEAPEPTFLNSDDSPIWSRHFSDETGPAECALLADTLELLGADRMIVAHTVQDGINSECDGQVWRVDVGLAAYYGGTNQVLEIVGNDVTPIAAAR